MRTQRAVRLASLALLLASIVATSATAQAAERGPSTSAPADGATAVAAPLAIPVQGTVARAGDGSIFVPDPTWTQIGGEHDGSGGPRQPATPGITPYLLDPVDHVQCNLRKNADHTVTWWTAKRTINYSGGRTDLKCGTDNVGYKHIKVRHQSEWNTRATEAGGGAWDDFMNWAVGATLAYPSATFIQTGQKACYTTPIQVYHDGRLVKTWQTRVVVSTNNKVVITAIPGGGCM